MKKVITTENKPIKLWLNDIEESALQQAKNLANLPFIYKHVAIMPDCHTGYGMPIGGVIATNGVIIPNAVGVDIGCGMCAIRTNIRQITKKNLVLIRELIIERVPVGFNHHTEKQNELLMPDVWRLHGFDSIVIQQYEAALYQLGTLGGGNHFIEIQKGSDGFIWIMIHSGSRNIGYKVANHYNKVAVKLNEQWFTSVEKSKELAFLPINTKEAKQYLKEMQFCVDFALASRKLMMESVKKSLHDVLDNIEFFDFINIAHNYARYEHHFNKNLIVHRKGATAANKGQIGIIPGSQGSKSYIVEGLGNPDSFMSCSHGAGRVMGRKQAKRELDFDTEIKKMKGIIHGMKSVEDLDESVSAYKDIDTVMENQKDLVKILIELKPLMSIKG